MSLTSKNKLIIVHHLRKIILSLRSIIMLMLKQYFRASKAHQEQFAKYST